MKKILMLTTFISICLLKVFSQSTEIGITVPAGGQEEQFTEWKKVEFVSGTETLSYEYRIAFSKRKALACNYNIQVKNVSSSKIKITIKTNYYDGLVKGYYGEEYKETIKPGSEQSFGIITQGCKEDKEKKDQSDFDRCKGCEFSYEIKAEAD